MLIGVWNVQIENQIAWTSKKQKCVALRNAAKFEVLSGTVKKYKWLKHFLWGIGE